MVAAPVRVLILLAATVLLGGCANLPFFGHHGDNAKDSAAPAEPQAPLYELEVHAPAPLRTLLLDYLDLSRFQNAPASAGACTSSS